MRRLGVWVVLVVWLVVLTYSDSWWGNVGFVVGILYTVYGEWAYTTAAESGEYHKRHLKWIAKGRDHTRRKAERKRRRADRLTRRAAELESK